MKRYLAVAVLSLSFILSACGSSTPSSSTTSTSSNASAEASLQSEVDRLTKENEALKKMVAKSVTDQVSSESTEETTVTNSDNSKFKDITVTITDKKNYDKDYDADRYSAFIELPYSITNNTDKDIKGIQGVLHVNDMFGEGIKNIQFDLTEKNVPAGKTIEVDGFGMEVNEFMDSDMQFYNTAYENLLFEYDFSKVIFTDGSTIE